MKFSFVIIFSILLALASAERPDNGEENVNVPSTTTANKLNNRNRKEFGGNAYAILRSEDKQLRVLEYKDAVEACSATTPEPSTLLVIKSQAETDFLVNWLFNEQEIQRKVWLDLVRVNGTNEFVWASEGQVQGQSQTRGDEYRNWHKCEPNDITVKEWNSPDWPEDCVEMYPNVYLLKV